MGCGSRTQTIIAQEAKLTLRLFNNVFSILGKLAAADAKAMGLATVPTASQLAERVVLLYMVPLLENTMEEIRSSDDPIAFLRVLQVRWCGGRVRSVMIYVAVVQRS